MKKKGTSSSKDDTTKSSSLKKKGTGYNDNHSEIDDNDVEEDVQWQTDTSLEAARQRIQEQLSAVTADMVMHSTNDQEKKTKPAPTKTNDGAENGNSTAHVKLVDELKANIKKGASANQVQSLVASSPKPASFKCMNHSVRICTTYCFFLFPLLNF